LCFKRRFSKDNSVIRLKSKQFGHQKYLVLATPLLLAQVRTAPMLSKSKKFWLA